MEKNDVRKNNFLESKCLSPELNQKNVRESNNLRVQLSQIWQNKKTPQYHKSFSL